MSHELLPAPGSSRWLAGPICLILGWMAPVSARAQVDGADDLNANATFDLDSAATDLARSCLALADGGIVLAGSASDDDGETVKIVLAKFLPGGGPDPGFGSAGQVVVDQSDLGFSFTDAAATAVAQQGDRIVVAGYRNNPAGSVYQPFLLRLLPNGAIDTAFGSNGWILPSHIRSVARMEVSPSTLDIWLVGPEADAADGRYWLLKFDSTETELFASFVYFGEDGNLQDLKLQPDGKALLVGSMDLDGGPGFRFGPALLRRLVDGNPDPSIGMGTGGWVYDFGASRFGRSVGVRPSGLLVLQGTFGAFAAEDLFVSWLALDGQVDPAIGTHTVGFNLGGTGGDGTLGVSQMVVQSDGKVVVAARALTGGNPSNWADIGVARFGAAGGLDSSFGGAGTGKRTFELWTPGSDGDDFDTCLTLAGGKPLIAGFSHIGANNWDFALKRLTSALIFTDGFEQGSVAFWSAAVP